MCMHVKHAYKYIRYTCIYLQLCMSMQLRWDSFCISFQAGLPQTQSGENTFLWHHIHPCVLFRATALVRFSNSGIEYQHIQQLHWKAYCTFYHTLKLITLITFAQKRQHEHFTTCHIAPSSYCFYCHLTWIWWFLLPVFTQTEAHISRLLCSPLPLSSQN